jgi:DNA-binding transcriptional LysR family regulator
MLPTLSTIASRLRIKQLRLLIALDEHGSLHKAAEIVAISQPGATKALQEIEATLGTTLFERTGKGLEPNDLGRCVIRYARLIYADLAHLREEMRGILLGHGGRLCVGVVMGAVPMLTEALARLRARQPELSVTIVEDTSARLLTLVEQARVDVAICRTSVSARPALFDCRPHVAERLVVVAHPRHPLAARDTLELRELAESRWVVFPVNMPMRLLLEREFREADLSFPAYPIETASGIVTLSLLMQHDDLVAVMPEDVARVAARHGMITVLPLELRSRNELCEIVTRHGAQLSVPAQLMIEELTA